LPSAKNRHEAPYREVHGLLTGISLLNSKTTPVYARLA